MWTGGLDPAKIEVIANGPPTHLGSAVRPPHEGRRASFGYFGNINPWKGMRVLLDAAGGSSAAASISSCASMARRSTRARPFTAEIDRLFAETDSHVLRLGSYERHEVGHLMAGCGLGGDALRLVGERALVIQEAQCIGVRSSPPASAAWLRRCAMAWTACMSCRATRRTSPA